MSKSSAITILLLLTICAIITFLQLNTTLSKVPLIPVMKSKHADCTRMDHNLKDILIAINYNWPAYASIPILKKFYGEVFGKVVFCGNDKHEEVIQIVEVRGFYGYECVQRAIELYPNYTGYIHSSDDVLLHWWNAVHFDKEKLWLGTDLLEGAQHEANFYNIKTNTPQSHPWWNEKDPSRVCGKAFKNIINLQSTDDGKKLNFNHHIKNFYENTKNRDICLAGRADFFYIPKRYAFAYAKVSQQYRKLNVHLEVSIPTGLLFFLTDSNYINMNGIYLPDRYRGTKYALGGEFEDIFSFQTSFYHPFKLSNPKNLHLFNEVVIPYSNILRVLCLS